MNNDITYTAILNGETVGTRKSDKWWYTHAVLTVDAEGVAKLSSLHDGLEQAERERHTLQVNGYRAVLADEVDARSPLDWSYVTERHPVNF